MFSRQVQLLKNKLMEGCLGNNVPMTFSYLRSLFLSLNVERVLQYHRSLCSKECRFLTSGVTSPQTAARSGTTFWMDSPHHVSVVQSGCASSKPPGRDLTLEQTFRIKLPTFCGQTPSPLPAWQVSCSLSLRHNHHSHHLSRCQIYKYWVLK